MADTSLSTTEAALRLGCAVSTVKKLIREDRLPAEKIGHDWRIDPADLASVTLRSPGYPAGRPRK